MIPRLRSLWKNQVVELSSAGYKSSSINRMVYQQNYRNTIEKPVDFVACLGAFVGPQNGSLPSVSVASMVFGANPQLEDFSHWPCVPWSSITGDSDGFDGMTISHHRSLVSIQIPFKSPSNPIQIPRNSHEIPMKFHEIPMKSPKNPSNSH